jgi:hypothetical protein
MTNDSRQAVRQNKQVRDTTTPYKTAMARLMAGVLRLKGANEPLFKVPDTTSKHTTTVEVFESNHHHVSRHAHKTFHCVAKQCLPPRGLQFGIPFPKLRQTVYV